MVLGADWYFCIPYNENIAQPNLMPAMCCTHFSMLIIRRTPGFNRGVFHRRAIIGLLKIAVTLATWSYSWRKRPIPQFQRPF